jgi:hypothetical protein
VLRYSTVEGERSSAGEALLHLLHEGISPSKIVLLGTRRLNDSCLGARLLSGVTSSRLSTTQGKCHRRTGFATRHPAASKGSKPTSFSCSMLTARATAAPIAVPTSEPREPGTSSTSSPARIRKAKAERDKPGGSTIGPTARRPSPRFFERKRPAGWETWVPLCHDSGSIQRARARIDERGGVAEIVHESWNPETASWQQSPLTIGDMEYLMYYPPAKPWTLWRQGVPLTEWCEEQLLSAINAS